MVQVSADCQKTCSQDPGRFQEEKRPAKSTKIDQN